MGPCSIIGDVVGKDSAASAREAACGELVDQCSAGDGVPLDSIAIDGSAVSHG